MSRSLKYFILSLVVGLILTPLPYLYSFFIVGAPFIFSAELLVELLAIFTTYSCVFMCVFESRWNYPMGIISTALYSTLFFLWGMLPLAVFNLYLVLSLTYGFFRWGPDTNTKPVTKVERPVWILYMAFAGIIWLTQHFLISLGIPMAPIEVWIATLSAVAQLLMDNKKIECWGLWAIVNVLSIIYFIDTDKVAVAIQYVFFLCNALYGAYQWFKSFKRDGGVLWEKEQYDA